MQVNKDVKDITEVDPSVFIDPNFALAHSYHLRTPAQSKKMTKNFHDWFLLTWGINITEGVYDPITSGYDISVGRVFPSTVIDPLDLIVYDSKHPVRGLTRNWGNSASSWFVSFNTSFVVQSGINRGVVIDNLSAIIYGYNYYLRNGANWILPINKESQLCYTLTTAKFFTNMYINRGAFGGLDSVIRFTCEGKTKQDLCFMSVTNMYTHNNDGSVDEIKRATLTC